MFSVSLLPGDNDGQHRDYKRIDQGTQHRARKEGEMNP